MAAIEIIKASEIYSKINNKEDIFILDVRNSEEYSEWKIEGETVISFNKPYFDLLDGVEEIMDKIPEDREVIVVCAKEGSSKFIAEMLNEKGLDVKYLQGGMKTWSEYLYKTEVFETDNYKVLQFIRVGKGCLSYMIISDDEALVVDPARFIDVYIEEATKSNVKITHIVDSHLHADHITGGLELAKATGAKYHANMNDGWEIDVTPLEDEEYIDISGTKVDVLSLTTPGHTPGSICLLLDNKYLFSGDTVFVTGLGRPDLGGKILEWAGYLYSSVTNKINQLDNGIEVLPGHCSDVNKDINDNGYIGRGLGKIKEENRIFDISEEESFISEIIKTVNSKLPPNFEKIISANRGVVNITAEDAQELEIGPNRCALHD